MANARKIDRIELFALSCRVDDGPVSSLAPMPTRNGLLLRLTCDDGAYGWGEAWCNYPPKGNLAKLNLLQDPIGPLVLGRDLGDWTSLRRNLERELARMIIHIGEPGPFNHCMAALDMAAADLTARAEGKSLSNMLNNGAGDQARVYASSPGVAEPDTLAARLTAMGHTGVKLKVGFDQPRDRALLETFRTHDDHAMMLCIDVNQNWGSGRAAETINELAQWDLAFVEEPILATAPASDWVALAKTCTTPLAAGENISSLEKFTEHVENGSLKLIQPDVAKWGGISGCIAAGRYALENGAGVTPHYMGTAVGLAASLHSLAALGGSGRVELDANPNPLRTELGPIDLTLNDGFVTLPEGAGIGFTPDPDALKRFSVGTCDIY
ncbi:MAG: mandelate racemase/muconate lactonizing enzyme family protein [Paracoccaceae bacterium]